MGIIMSGKWTTNTRAALQDGCVSTYSLELLTAARLVHVIAEESLLPVGWRTMVIRVDNMSACSCINEGREMYISMRRALSIMKTVQETFQVKVVVRNVRTEKNTVADLLRRGNLDRDREHMEGKKRWVEDETIMTGWESFVCTGY